MLGQRREEDSRQSIVEQQSSACRKKQWREVQSRVVYRSVEEGGAVDRRVVQEEQCSEGWGRVVQRRVVWGRVVWRSGEQSSVGKISGEKGRVEQWREVKKVVQGRVVQGRVVAEKSVVKCREVQ